MKKGLKWGNVYFREYARFVGGGCGVPEDEGSEWPLGISDSIVVYDERGVVSGAVKAFSNEHVPVYYRDSETSTTTPSSPHLSPKDSEGNDSTSIGNNTNVIAPALLSLPLQGPQDELKSDETFTNTTIIDSSRLQSIPPRNLLPGEQFGGTVEEYDVKLSLFKLEREEESIKAALALQGGGKKKKKKRQSTTAASASIIGWKSLSPLERKKLFLEVSVPLAIPVDDLVSTNEKTSNELQELVENRRESNTGCSCALYTREGLVSQPLISLRARCTLRGVSSEGGKRALIAKLIEHSRLHPGCMRGSTVKEAESTASSAALPTETLASSTASDYEQVNPLSRKRKRSNSDGTDDLLNLEQLQSNLTSLNDSSTITSSDIEAQSIKSETNAFVDSLATLARAHKSAQQLSKKLCIPDDAPKSSTTGSASVSFCPCEVAGLGCHFNTCSCDSECCSNLPFGDPSAAAYDDGGIFVSRDIIMRMTKETNNLFFSPEDCKVRRNQYLQELEDQMLQEIKQEEELGRIGEGGIIDEAPIDSAFQSDAMRLIQAAALGNEDDDDLGGAESNGEDDTEERASKKRRMN
jgi:hypothetical protein